MTRNYAISFSYIFTNGALPSGLLIKLSISLSVSQPHTSSNSAARHKKSPETIKTLIDDFVKTCSITPVDSQTIDESIASEFNDFEDAMQYYSALREGADLIITRNKDDYMAAKIPVYEPQEYLDLLAKH